MLKMSRRMLKMVLKIKNLENVSKNVEDGLKSLKMVLKNVENVSKYIEDGLEES